MWKLAFSATAAAWTARDSGFDPRKGQTFFLFIVYEGHPSLAYQLVPGVLHGDEVKGPEREADHSVQCTAEVENAWRYTYASPHVLMT
jgi:hypothetical protein